VKAAIDMAEFAVMALIASPVAGQTFRTAFALFFMVICRPAVATGRRTPFVPSAAVTRTKFDVRGAASVWILPVAATVVGPVGERILSIARSLGMIDIRKTPLLLC